MVKMGIMKALFIGIVADAVNGSLSTRSFGCVIFGHPIHRGADNSGVSRVTFHSLSLNCQYVLPLKKYVFPNQHSCK